MKHKKSFLGLSIILGTALLVAFATYWDLLKPQELLGYDWLMRTRPDRQTSKDIAIIEISDDTLRSLGRWPLPRNFHAALIKALDESQAKLIVFDILFSESSVSDEAMLTAMQKSGKVYLPAAFNIPQETLKDTEIPHSKEMLGGVLESFKQATAGTGHINLFLDADGKSRRLPLWIRYGDKLLPSMGLLIASKQLGVALDDTKARINENSLWINYPGKWTSTFQHFSYLDVLKAYADKQKGIEPWLDLTVFKDKICFIGLTAAGTSDLRPTPLEPVYPMVGAQASVCDSILRHDFIFRAPLWARMLINIAVFLAALLLCLKFTPLPAFLACALLNIIYTSSLWIIFNTKGFFADIFLPLITTSIVYTFVLFYKFLLERQKRLLLEQELEIAASIQRSFLPQDLKHFCGIEIRTFLNAAKFVAGDFYDVIVLDETTLGVFIGDVSGKGISAALIMAQAISLLRVITQHSKNPSHVLNALSFLLVPILKGRFVTGQYLVIDTKKGLLEGACAGHPSLLYLNSAASIIDEPLPASGPPLGLIKEAAYTTIQKQLSCADKIFMYTDGWTEGRDKKGKEFGLEKLKGSFLNKGKGTIDEVLSGLITEHTAFEGTAQHDDLTAVILEFQTVTPT